MYRFTHIHGVFKLFINFFLKYLHIAPDSRKQKLSTGNEAPSSSNSENQEGTACLMHFVDRDIHNNSYLANGALIDRNRVLTTRDFLEPYKRDTGNRNLYVYPHNWKNENQIQRVNEAFVDNENRSQLAVAHVSNHTRLFKKF